MYTIGRFYFCSRFFFVVGVLVAPATLNRGLVAQESDRLDEEEELVEILILVIFLSFIAFFSLILAYFVIGVFLKRRSF